MDTKQVKKKIFVFGFVIGDVHFGYSDGKIYQLPYINQYGRYYGLRVINSKKTKNGWVYYRIRRQKIGIVKLTALLKSVNWSVEMPANVELK